MATRETKSPSPSRIRPSSSYSGSRMSPRRRSRSPIHRHSSPVRSRRGSQSQPSGSRDTDREERMSREEGASYSGRHNIGPTVPLPPDSDLKKLKILVNNPLADPNSKHNGTVCVAIEDIKIPRRIGEGSNHLFAFLECLSPPSRRVIIVRDSPIDVKQESNRSQETMMVSNTADLSSGTRDFKAYDSSRRENSSPSYREQGHSRSEWGRERCRSYDQGSERNGGRDNRRGDFHERGRRRDDRERSSPRSRDRERLSREDQRERTHERERDKPQNKDLEKEKGKDNPESSRSSANDNENHASSENHSGPLQIRPPLPHLGRGTPRIRGPMYPMPMPCPPFLARGPIPPPFLQPRNMPPHMFGPPPFPPPRMMGPRPRY